MIYKFVKHEIPPLEKYVDTTMYKLHEKLEREDPLTRAEKNLLVFDDGWTTYKRGGWAYDFEEWMTEYFVQYTWGSIQIVWAWDKTAIRESGKFSSINRIVEVD